MFGIDIWRVMPRQQIEPGPPDRIGPIEFKVMNPMLDPHDRRTGSAYRVGDARAIAAPAKSDLLR